MPWDIKDSSRFPAYTGDVTNPAGSSVTTIADDAVTYAKLQNVTTSRLLGRTTAGSGDCEELTVGTGLTLSAGSLKSDWTYVVLGGDVSDTTGALVDSGLTFTPVANKIYEIECRLVFISAATTTGFHWSFVDTATATWVTGRQTVPTLVNAEIGKFGPFATVAGTTVSAINTEYLANGNAMYKTQASPAGVVKIQFNTEVPASAVTLRAGSFLKYRAIN